MQWLVKNLIGSILELRDWIVFGIFGFLMGAFALFLFVLPIYNFVISKMDAQQKAELIEELRKEYPITAAKSPSHLIQNVFDLEVSCEDSFNQNVYKAEVPYFVARSSTGDEVQLKKRTVIYFDGIGSHRFEKTNTPNKCSINDVLSKSKHFEVGASFQFDGTCTRSENALELLRQLYPRKLSEFKENYFFDQENYWQDDNYIFRRSSDAKCTATVTGVSPCFTNRHLTEAGRGKNKNWAKVEFSEFLTFYFELNRCENPDHEKFKSEVIQRWADQKVAN